MSIQNHSDANGSPCDYDHAEGVGLAGHPDSDDPLRRTITGRVVRWAGWMQSFCDERGRFFDVEVCGPGLKPMTLRLHETSGRAAESRALATTR